MKNDSQPSVYRHANFNFGILRGKRELMVVVMLRGSISGSLQLLFVYSLHPKDNLTPTVRKRDTIGCVLSSRRHCDGSLFFLILLILIDK